MSDNNKVPKIDIILFSVECILLFLTLTFGYFLVVVKNNEFKILLSGGMIFCAVSFIILDITLDILKSD